MLFHTDASNDVTVFIGNLPLYVTINNLESMFSKFGTPYYPRTRTTSNKKFAQKDPNWRSIIGYVNFDNLESAKASLALNKTKLGGHVLRVALVTDMKAKTTPNDRTIFVGNLRTGKHLFVVN